MTKPRSLAEYRELHSRVLERWVLRECDNHRPLHRYPAWWPVCLLPLSVRAMREIRRRHDNITKALS
jgi:hypothetical protein